MDWLSHYYSNVLTTQSHLQIQCSPYQKSISIFHRMRTNNLKICMEATKDWKSQRNLETED